MAMVTWTGERGFSVHWVTALELLVVGSLPLAAVRPLQRPRGRRRTYAIRVEWDPRRCLLD
jgi:hypothetical protein